MYFDNGFYQCTTEYRIFGRIFGQNQPNIRYRIFGRFYRYADNKKRPFFAYFAHILVQILTYIFLQILIFILTISFCPQHLLKLKIVLSNCHVFDWQSIFDFTEKILGTIWLFFYVNYRPNIRPNIRPNPAEYSVSADTTFGCIGRSLV